MTERRRAPRAIALHIGRVRHEPVLEQPPPAHISCEKNILEALEARPVAGETIAAMYRRREHELGTLLARLTLDEAVVLHRRLTTPRSDDRIAVAFGRMIAERRARLIAFLADARRRSAISACPRLTHEEST